MQERDWRRVSSARIQLLGSPPLDATSLLCCSPFHTSKFPSTTSLEALPGILTVMTKVGQYACRLIYWRSKTSGQCITQAKSIGQAWLPCFVYIQSVNQNHKMCVSSWNYMGKATTPGYSSEWTAEFGYGNLRNIWFEPVEKKKKTKWWGGEWE